MVKLWLMPMNKTIVLCLMMIFFTAAAEARYVRKLREPDFFIPADDRMHKPEKLPPVQKIVSQDSTEEEKQVKFTEIPEYKKKYSRYLADMAVFANTKSFPVNEAFDADMAVFTDGKIFEVTETADQNITTREQKSFYSLVDSIVKN